MRLFVALALPERVRGELTTALAAVRAEAPAGLRWSDPSRWHLTLAFLGEVDERRLPELATRLTRAAARHEAPSLSLAGGGRFGRTVLWVGVEVVDGAPTGLAPLAGSVAAAARRVGIAQEERPYRPHLTVARAAAPVDLRPAVQALAGVRTSAWTPTDVELVRSRLGPRPEHTVLDRYPLAQAAS